MKKIFTLASCLLSLTLFSQILNLPARPATDISGSQFARTIWSTSMSLTDREDSIYAQIIKGNVPNFYRNLNAVTSTATVGSKLQSVTYYVIPDMLAIGCDSDYFLCPMSPMLATKIGSLTGTTLPTRKMVGDIWTAASMRLSPHPLPPISPAMSEVPYFAHHDTIVDSARDSYFPGKPLGDLTTGDKKDVVISNLIYSTANRVVIFGWYYTTGTYIQPMTNVHADTYMDYSHGIRLVQNNCMLNGTTPTTIQCILESNNQDSILSDEGQIAEPWYPYYISLNTPTSFAVLRNSPTSLKLIVKNDPAVTHYDIFTSPDGTNYTEHLRVPKSNLVVSGLPTDQLCFVKIMAYDSLNGTTSAMSEVLAAVPSSRNDSTLMVSGFERVITGNTFNFTIQHGNALFANNRYTESCTHKAITDKLLTLNKYRMVDWIVGEQGTTDSTFTPAEQNYITAYLQQGGYLFTSGSEIGYDLFLYGSVADKSFYNNYLKARFISDAPDNSASTFYSSLVKPIATSIFGMNDTLNFDNGTHGTYDVKYPDAIAPLNGSQADLHYNTPSDTEYACVHFAGIFTGGTKLGKLVYMGYPFETIYPSANRDTAMKDILIFFFGNNSITTGITEFANQTEVRVYPNPNNGRFTIQSSVNSGQLSVEIFNLLGQSVYSQSSITNSQFSIDISSQPAGIYIYMVRSENGALVANGKIIKQ